MKLFKLSQEINPGYDTYDSVVVCAENEEEARHIHPSEFVTHYHDGNWYGNYSVGNHEEYITENEYGTWVLFNEIDKINVEYIGEAAPDVKKGVIVASFNAG